MNRPSRWLPALVAATALILTGLPAHGHTSASSAVTTSAAAVAAKGTRVIGWSAARRAATPHAELASIVVTGPVGRPVKVQKRSKGKWKTVRTLKTPRNRTLDLSTLAQRSGRYRLVVPAWRGWRAKKTAGLRVAVARSTDLVVTPSEPGTASSEAGTASSSTNGTSPAPGVSVGSVVSSGVYGTAYNMDTLANMQVGGSASGASNTYVSYRFRAERSDSLVAFRAYWLGAQYPGYGGGTGGTIRVSVQSDSGGVPSGTVLAYTDVVRPSAVMPLISFASPAQLTAGTLYHLVFTNIDPSPTVNFVSVDLSYVYGGVLSPRQPGASDSDYAALRKFGTGSWSVQGGYTPIIDLTYGSGAHQGRGYMEVEVGNKAVIAGSSSMVRERFTVSGGSRQVAGAAVRIARTSGSGNLVVRLQDGSGAVIDSFSVSTASVPTLTSGDNSSGVWVSGSFSAPRSIVQGSTYFLTLSTDSATSLWTRGIQQGDTYGFDRSTYFADGVLQVTTNGGSSWSTVPGLGDSGDLQFYLK